MAVDQQRVEHLKALARLQEVVLPRKRQTAEIIDFKKAKRDRDSGHYHGPKSKKPTR